MVAGELSPFHFHDAGGEAVDEVAVVGDEDNGAGKGLEGIKEDVLAEEVQVVGGLVHEEQVRGAQKHLCQGETVALSAGEDRHLLVDVVAGEEEGAEYVPQLRHHGKGGVGEKLVVGCLFTVEDLGLVLGEVVEGHIVPHDPLPPFKGFAGHDPHEGRFSGAVMPHKGDPLPFLHGEIDAVQHHVGAVGLHHAGKLHGNPAAGGGIGKAETDFFALRRKNYPFDLLQLLDAGLDEGRLIGLVAEPADEVLDLLDFLILAPLRLPQGRHPLFPLDEVAAVGAVVVGEDAVPDLRNPVADLVHEEPVVGDEDDRMGIFAQVPLQPVAGLDVQVVGGLVQQEYVGLFEQKLRQGDPHLPPAGELAAVAPPVCGEKTEAVQHPARLRLHGVAPPQPELLLEMAVALQKGIVLRVVGGDFLQAAGEHGQFPLHLLEVVQGRHHLGQEPRAPGDDAVLGEVADGGSLGKDQLAGGMFHEPGNYFHEGRLAGAVLPHEAHPLTLFQVPVDTGKEGPARKVFGKILEMEHGIPFRYCEMTSL